jgi:hypothetical protein
LSEALALLENRKPHTGGLMLNVYTFHSILVDKNDRRMREEVKHNQEATNLNQAWDRAEAHFAEKHPDKEVTLSVGNRQPIQLRPGFRRA